MAELDMFSRHFVAYSGSSVRLWLLQPRDAQDERKFQATLRVNDLSHNYYIGPS